jgi:hypothetical protein
MFHPAIDVEIAGLLMPVVEVLMMMVPESMKTDPGVPRRSRMMLVVLLLLGSV